MAAILTPVPAAAGEDDAKTMFAAGRDLRAAGRCEDAIIEFRRALDVYPEGLGSLRNIAECEEQIGKYAAARRDWWDLRRAAMQSNEAKYDGWDKDAEAAYARLGSKVARVTVALKGVQLDRVRVAMDGKPLDPRLVGVELERDLGAHTVEAYYGGAAPVTGKITLAEGSKETVTLTIPDPTPTTPRPSGSAAGPTAPPPDTGSKTLRTAGFVALGLGGVGAAGTVVSLVIRQSALGAVKDACPEYESKPCPSSVSSDKSRGETASLLVNVFGGLAIVGVGVGVGLLIAGSGSEKAAAGAAPRAWVGVAPVAGGAAGQARVAF